MKRYLAIDIGASSGRAMIACLHEGKIQMEEIHRFQNHSQENADGSLFWDVENLFEQILIALTKAKELGKQPDSIAVDTWGVDYVLVDEQGKPLEGCHSYRDPKRDFANEVHERIRFEELYSRTGIQFQRFNTIYQLYADSLSGVLTRAHKMLSKSRQAGFEWNQEADALAKVDEELAEVHAALASGNEAQIEEEIGDLLLAVTHLCRWHELQAEEVLQKAIAKYDGRFRKMEGILKEETGRDLASCSKEEMIDAWNKAKS